MSQASDERRTNLQLRTWIDELQADRELLESALVRLPGIMGELDVTRLLHGATALMVDLSAGTFGMFVAGDEDLETVTIRPEVLLDPPDLTRAPILAAALTDGTALSIDDVERWAPSLESARPYGTLRGRHRVRSYIGAPVTGRQGHILGVVLIGHSEPRAFTHRQQKLIAGLASQLGVAVENALLFDERRRMARALQETLLPPILPEIPGIDIGARYRATGHGLEVGGDFYDVFEVDDDCWAVVIGDVSGVGPEAAAVTGLARYTVRALARQESDPATVLALLNETIHAHPSTERFCTAVYLRLRPTTEGGATITIASGGHPEPYVVRDDGSVEAVTECQGMLLGLFPDAELTAGKVHLAAGEALVLYTDGVIEARDQDGEQFGEERLAALLRGCAGRTAESIARRVELAAIDWQGGTASDDVAVVVVRAAG